jgi:hypothetical protein
MVGDNYWKFAGSSFKFVNDDMRMMMVVFYYS